MHVMSKRPWCRVKTATSLMRAGKYHPMKENAQVTAPGAITSMIAAVSTRPNKPNRSTCSRIWLSIALAPQLSCEPAHVCWFLEVRRTALQGGRAQLRSVASPWRVTECVPWSGIRQTSSSCDAKLVAQGTHNRPCRARPSPGFNLPGAGFRVWPAEPRPAKLDACRPGCPPAYGERDLCVPFIARRRKCLAAAPTTLRHENLIGRRDRVAGRRPT
jgi:hypothetical protein